MKFLVDAQLPLRLVAFLNERGHDAIHTSTMPEGNRSKDRATGNITNSTLLDLVEANLDGIVAAYGNADFVQPGADSLSVHPRPAGP